VTILLYGFGTAEAYERREPDWAPDDVFDDVAAATAAARSWIEATGPDAEVEVVKVKLRRGTVVRVVTASGHEDIFRSRPVW